MGTHEHEHGFELPTRPMLAAKVTDLAHLQYPLLLSPKLDGIRCLLHPELGPVTRTFKPIPNGYVREQLMHHRHKCLDGELMLRGSQDFNSVQSAMMTRSGQPQFDYFVFDCFEHIHRPYDLRVPDFAVVSMQDLEGVYHRDGVGMSWDGYDSIDDDGNRIIWLPQFIIENYHAATTYYEEFLNAGYEGVVLRTAHGPYKSGRSTLRQQYLLKYKVEHDTEAEIVGYVELLRNMNEDKKDAFGLAKRSSHLAGQIPGGTLGALIVHADPWGEFQLGSGFSAAQRDDIWARRDELLGTRVKFKYQAEGEKDKPRFPIFISLLLEDN